MIRRRFIRTTAPLLLALFVSHAAPARQANDDPRALINSTLIPPGSKDATDTLFPALAKLDAPPKSPATLRAVSLMTPASKDWAAWDAWAGSEPQRAALEALKTITDPQSRYTLGLRFGRDNTKPEYVAANLYIDLGEPPLLASAPAGMRYLERFDTLTMLCTVEAQRLAAADKPDECLAVMVQWLRFARMIADRPFAREKAWGLRQMDAALERLGDLACSHPGLFKEKTIQDAAKELDSRAIAPERVRFPTGEREALAQLTALAVEERGGPKPDAFGPTIARLTYDRANQFDLFPQAAYWGEIGKQHAGWFDTRDTTDKVLNDWQKRWELNDIFDDLMKAPTDYSKMDRLKFAMVDQVVKDIPELFDLRTRMVTSLRGIRSGLGVVGYRSVQGQWPPTLSAVQPRFVEKLDDDPWFYERERRVRDYFRYFVPMRDLPVGPRELPKPHPVRIDLSNARATADAPQAEMVVREVVNDAFKELREIAPRMLDASGSVDLAKLKEAWLEASKQEARRVHADATELESLRLVLQLTSSMTQEELLEASRAMLQNADAQRALVAESRSLGLAPEELKEYLLARDQAVFATEGSKALRAAVRDGKPITIELLDAMVADAIEAFATQENTDKYFKKILTALASPSGTPEGPAITASITDKDFILYSVGPNMKPEFAKNVSPTGPDILVWPPVLTLERRALSPN